MKDAIRSPSFKPAKVSLIFVPGFISRIIPHIDEFAEIVLHQPSGLLYAACSTPWKRKFWIPGLGHLDASARLEQEEDYIATYDHTTSTVSRLYLSGFEDPRGLFVHGFDVVPSSTDPNELFVYVINHRPPVDEDPTRVGSDSVMEIFRTTVGDGTLRHVTTVRDPVIETPNDVVGLSDGKSFYFTNDHGRKIGWVSPSTSSLFASYGLILCNLSYGSSRGIWSPSEQHGVLSDIAMLTLGATMLSGTSPEATG